MPYTIEPRVKEAQDKLGEHAKLRDDSLRLSERTSLLLLGLLTVLAAIVRIIATQNDLWLDEIISVQIANALRTPWQIFTDVHSGNNHQTNTLYLYFVRNESYAPLFRYLSVVWGVAVVPAGYWLLARRSRAEALILSVLLACSYPLIHFSSEARGYAGAVFGTVLACGALTRWMTERDGKALILGAIYGLGLTLAVLSHVTSCLVWFPLAIGSLIVVAGEPERGKRVAQWIAFNLLPASVLAELYVLDRQFLTQLGGPPMTVLHGLARLLANLVGWPLKDAVTAWVVIVPLAALVVWRLVREHKTREPLSLLLMLIYVATLVSVVVMHPEFFSPRYFLVVAPFVYAGFAMLLGRLVATRGGRVALGAILAVFLAGQSYLFVKFLRVGRGEFTEALQYMMKNTAGTRVSVGSNQDFRSTVELAYFAPRVLKNRQLVYVTQESQASSPLDWYIFHGEGYEPPGPAVLNAPGQPTWYRVAYFGASELSGQAWTIYSHQPAK